MQAKYEVIKSMIEDNYDYIYVDLDDTLIFKHGIPKPIVNYKLISFLYYSLNSEKKLFLITKTDDSDKELKKELKEFCLNGLFSFKRDNIIHLVDTDHKHDYMKKDSILIDNSVEERLDAATAGYPAISADSACLLMQR